jgi:mono/diheme cytochrome c family protein
MYKISGVFILIGLAVVLSACSFSLAADITPPPGSEQQPIQQATEAVLTSSVYPIVPPNLQNGAKIYNQECAQCHGTLGLGDGPQAAQLSVPVATLGLSDFSRQYTPAEWYRVVKQGNMERFMPAFANLTDRQRWDVVAYAMSLSTSDSLIARGKTLFQENCSTCHGLSGKGDGPDAADLSTPPVDFTDQSKMAQTSAASLYQAISSGIAPDMPAFLNTLDDNERWALVSYLRSLTNAIPAQVENAYPSPAINVETVSSLNAYPAPQAYPDPQAYPSPLAYPNPVATQNLDLTTTTEVSPTAPFIGTVSVQLINGSGGDVPSDVPVILYGFDNMQNTYSETLTAGVGGVYTFTNILMPGGRVFLAGTEYASGTYPSDIATVDPATPNLQLQITIYDTTTDTSALTTDRLHIVFDFSDPQNVQVMEVFIISNPSELAVVAPTQDGTVVTFPLPHGYSNLQFQDGELGDRYVKVGQGFADTATVNPGVGDYTIIFAFEMPYNRKLDFIQPMFLPTSAVVVMVPDNGVKVDSNQLQDGGTRDINGSTYHMFTGSSLLASSSLDFTLSGNPKKAVTSIFSTGTMQNLAIGLGVFGVALVLGGLWLFRRNQIKVARQRTTEGIDLGTTGSQVDAMPEDEDTLMDAIIALDDQYRAGNLPEEAYLKRRAVLKDKLRKIDQG